MVQMQGVGDSEDKGLLVLGATNLPWGLDSAMRRRFEKRVYISLPDEKTRATLLKKSMEKEEHSITDKDFIKIAGLTKMYSGSDICNLVKNACFGPLRKFQQATSFIEVGKTREGLSIWEASSSSNVQAKIIDKKTLKNDQIRKNKVDFEDFAIALKNTKPTVGPSELVAYEKWTKDFGMEG